MTRPRLGILLALGTAGLLALAGCASSPTAAETPAADRPVRIVASTDVYGDVAASIAGDHAEVTSLIVSADRDPHEFQPSARDQLALSKARIVIENGGGYDDFMDRMLSASGNKRATVLNAVDISGRDQHPADGEFNEHVWYDLPTVGKLADRLVTALSKADPSSSAVFRKNGADFSAKLAALQKREQGLRNRYAGRGVGITEPVPGYMLAAIGLVNTTPEAFSEAVEEDRDVAPSVLAATLAGYADGRVDLLVYNRQAGGPQAEKVVVAAKKNGVPVVGVTETLPAGTHYLSWMSANLDAIASALRGAS